MINSITGKTVQGKISRIAKQGFFVRYAELVGGLPNILAARRIEGDYGEVKAGVREYQIAKSELFLAFKREDLGSWLKKPMEQDQFHLPSANSNNSTPFEDHPMADATMTMLPATPPPQQQPAVVVVPSSNGNSHNCSSNHHRNGAQKVRTNRG